MRKPKQEKHAYDVRVALWLNRDPIEEGGGVHLYGFVSNNPVNWFDALGLMTTTVSNPQGALLMAELAGDAAKAAAIRAMIAQVAAQTAAAALLATKAQEKLDDFARSSKGKNNCDKAKEALQRLKESLQKHKDKIPEHENKLSNPSDFVSNPQSS